MEGVKTRAVSNGLKSATEAYSGPSKKCAGDRGSTK